MKNIKIKVGSFGIGIKEINFQKYISLTDIAKKKNYEEPRFAIINWLRSRNTLEFLGIWEQIHNPNFNRVGFDTIKSNAGLNSFTISPSKWVGSTNALGIISKSGRYGSGTYAHEDIALEFAKFTLVDNKNIRQLEHKEKTD